MGKREELEAQKLQKLVALGDEAHFQVRAQKMTDPKLCAISEEIIALDKELHALSGIATPEKGDGICPSCQTKIEGEVKFCGNCGTNIEEYYSKKTARCVKCECIIGCDDQYCPVCGSKREG